MRDAPFDGSLYWQRWRSRAVPSWRWQSRAVSQPEMLVLEPVRQNKGSAGITDAPRRYWSGRRLSPDQARLLDVITVSRDGLELAEILAVVFSG